jgi:hypothetical protein
MYIFISRLSYCYRLKIIHEIKIIMTLLYISFTVLFILYRKEIVNTINFNFDYSYNIVLKMQYIIKNIL